MILFGVCCLGKFSTSLGDTNARTDDMDENIFVTIGAV